MDVAKDSELVLARAPEQTRCCSAVQVDFVNDRTKPYFGERGLFASQFIACGTIVSEYLGKVRLADASCKSTFVIVFPNSFAKEETELVRIDAMECGNESRFANHAADKNNCEFNWRWIKGKLRILIVAVADIGKGEEILVNYGTGFFK
jgi:SET domain-containing protein